MEQWPTDIIIYAVIAAGLVLWLRNILGTRHGQERQRPDPFTPRPDAGSQDDTQASSTVAPSIRSGRHSHADFADDAAQSGLVQIALADRHFDAADFVEKAQDAFTFIITAFAEGDKETLKTLLDTPVYKAFDDAISQREAKGETVTTEVHAIRNVRIIEAGLEKKRHAKVTLRFTADETCVIRDKEGQLISGHPDHVSEMVDVWVFGRDVRSSDPRWLLVETRDDQKEDHKTPIPEV